MITAYIIESTYKLYHTVCHQSIAYTSVPTSAMRLNMKLPNSYGSVIKLGGKRRKPYAVRISKPVEDDTGKVKRKYTYLAEYNSGAVVPEHMKYSDSPTFAEMYEKWKKY